MTVCVGACLETTFLLCMHRNPYRYMFVQMQQMMIRALLCHLLTIDYNVVRLIDLSQYFIYSHKPTLCKVHVHVACIRRSLHVQYFHRPIPVIV